MKAGEFTRRLRADSEMPDKRFAFFLGAGCSISSGIPGAASLVKDYWLPRYRELCAPDRKDVDAWTKEEFPDYDPKNPAASYGAVMGCVFLNPEDRQQEIERLCDGRFPGFGYAVLAKLIAREGGKFNVVITTNFDDLVSDSLYLFTTARPLVIGHESLAGFIRPTRTRPLVVKLHGDAHLAPQNTAAETGFIVEEVERQVRGLLNDRGLIIVGYGGNDEGIQRMLSALPREALPFGIYWISGSEPQCLLRSWLEERKAVWVDMFDFDEMLLLVRDTFDLAHPDPKPFDAIFQNYTDTYKKLSERIRSVPVKAGDESLKSALERADKEFTNWWSVEMKASKFFKTDPEKADEIYTEGIMLYPNSAPLIGNYALFLQNIRKDYDKAELLFLRAIAADPNHANSLNNYAVFLKNIRKDYDKAEQYYLRALEVDPNYADTLYNYAIFLDSIPKDYDKAEQFYQRALQSNPNDADTLNAYASFLQQIRKDYDKAEQYYLRALELEPNGANKLGNYAGFLLSRGKNEQGYPFLNKALSFLPASHIPGLAAELWFYAFCHWPEEKRQEAFKNLKKALLEGERSLNWDLSANVERARQDGHPDIKWIEILADVITKGDDIKKLDAWPAWKKA
jgi:protein O-mannosyl-transferase